MRLSPNPPTNPLRSRPRARPRPRLSRFRARRLAAVLAASALVLVSLASCGDDGGDTGSDAGGDADGAAAVDDAEDADTEDADTEDADADDAGETVTVGNPDDPCSLLSPSDFEEVLDATSVSDPEDVSEAFGFANEGQTGIESSTCQWQVERSGDDAAFESFSVQLRVVAGAGAQEAYEAQIDFVETSATEPEQQPEPIEVGAREAVSYRDFGDPVVVALASELAVNLDSSSDDIDIGSVAELVERVLAAAED